MAQVLLIYTVESGRKACTGLNINHMTIFECKHLYIDIFNPHDTTNPWH